MAQRQLPGLGLTGFWDLGYRPWKDENDANLRIISALLGMQALDLVAATPASPVDGQIYLFSAAHPTQPNKLAIRDVGAWIYLTPLRGAIMYDLAAGYHRTFNGTNWVALLTAGLAPTETILIAVGDETTAITTGVAKVTFRMPYAFTVTAVRASLTTVSSSGIPAIDINEAGVSILSTKLTIDASEKTSTTAATPLVISDARLADDAEMTIDIDVAGTGAAGLKVAIIGYRT